MKTYTNTVVKLKPVHNVTRLRACRVCLETNTKLLNLHQYKLAQSFEDVTGTPVSPTDGLPQHICNKCGRLLQKSAAFRAQCRQTDVYLQNMLVQMPQIMPRKYKRKTTRGQWSEDNMSKALDAITTDVLSNLNTLHFKFPLTVTKTLVVSVPEDSAASNNYDNIVKIEANIKDEQISKIYVDQSMSHILDDKKFDIEIDTTNDFSMQLGAENIEITKIKSMSDDDVIIIDDDDDSDFEISEIDNKIEEHNYGKRKHNTEDSRSANNDTNVDDDEELKKFLINKSKIKNNNKSSFYDYILSKYIHKTRDIHEPEMDADICDLENVDLTENNDYQLPTNTDPDKDMFYYFIRQKYIKKKNNFKKNKKFDINKIRVDVKTVNKINTEKELTVSTFTENGRNKSKQEWDDFAQAYNFEIILLSKKEQIKKLQARKEHERYASSKYKCETCYRGFVSETVYMNHMLSHDPSSGSLECDICHLRFKKSRTMIKHTSSHKMTFICKTCNRVFPCSFTAKRHYEVHLGTEYKCQYCDKTFRTYKARVEHIRFHHGSTPCEICYQKFPGARASTLHKVLAHKQTYPCASCDLQFDNQLALEKHKDASADGTCHPEMSPCRKCGETYENDQLLASHIENEHRLGMTVNRLAYRKRASKDFPMGRDKKVIKRCCTCWVDKRRKFIRASTSIERTDSYGNNVERTISDRDCVKSDEDFERTSSSTFDNDNTQFELNQPIGGETVEVIGYDEQLECDSPFDIERSMPYQEDRVEQNNEDRVEQDKGKTKAERTCPCVGTDRETRCPCSRSNDYEVMCEMCGLSCQSATALRIHQRGHTGEKPYQCSHCDKRFRCKASLKTHERTHTGERPYKCQYCDKAFTSSGNLDRHELVHTKMRPHSCDVCGKTFQTTSCVKLHIRTVHMRIPAKPRIRNKRKKIQ